MQVLFISLQLSCTDDTFLNVIIIQCKFGNARILLLCSKCYMHTKYSTIYSPNPHYISSVHSCQLCWQPRITQFTALPVSKLLSHTCSYIGAPPLYYCQAEQL